MAWRDVTVSDVERLTAVAEGEHALAMTEEAFRSFYDRTSRSVWGYLARLTGDPAMADDLLQDAYYRFLRAGGTHENEVHRRNTLSARCGYVASHSKNRATNRANIPPSDFSSWLGSNAPASEGFDIPVLESNAVA